MKILLISTIVVLFILLLMVPAKKSNVQNEDFVYNIVDIDEEKTLAEVSTIVDNTLLKMEDIKPKFKEYAKDFLNNFFKNQIQTLKQSKPKKPILSDRAKKISRLNREILKKNKNVRIVVVNNKRYIFNKKDNSKIKEETLELFRNCQGPEGPNPSCPCDDPEAPCSKQGYGYCCYNEDPNQQQGICSSEPCMSDYDNFLSNFLPAILYAIATALIVTFSPVLVVLGAILLVGTIIFELVRTESVSAGTVAVSANDIYDGYVEYETVGQSLIAKDSDNVIIETEQPPNHSGVTEDVAYIAGGRIPESILVQLAGTIIIGPAIFGCEQWINFGVCDDINQAYQLPFIINTVGGTNIIDDAYRNCCPQQQPQQTTSNCTSECNYNVESGQTLRSIICDGNVTSVFVDSSCCHSECRNNTIYEVCENGPGNRITNTGKSC